MPWKWIKRLYYRVFFGKDGPDSAFIVGKISEGYDLRLTLRKLPEPYRSRLVRNVGAAIGPLKKCEAAEYELERMMFFVRNKYAVETKQPSA